MTSANRGCSTSEGSWAVVPFLVSVPSSLVLHSRSTAANS